MRQNFAKKLIFDSTLERSFVMKLKKIRRNDAREATIVSH